MQPAIGRGGLEARLIGQHGLLGCRLILACRRPPQRRKATGLIALADIGIEQGPLARRPFRADPPGDIGLIQTVHHQFRGDLGIGRYAPTLRDRRVWGHSHLGPERVPEGTKDRRTAAISRIRRAPLKIIVRPGIAHPARQIDVFVYRVVDAGKYGLRIRLLIIGVAKSLQGRETKSREQKRLTALREIIQTEFPDVVSRVVCPERVFQISVQIPRDPNFLGEGLNFSCCVATEVGQRGTVNIQQLVLVEAATTRDRGQDNPVGELIIDTRRNLTKPVVLAVVHPGIEIRRPGRGRSQWVGQEPGNKGRCARQGWAYADQLAGLTLGLVD